MERSPYFGRESRSVSVLRSDHRTILSLGCDSSLDPGEKALIARLIDDQGGWLFRSELEGLWVSFPGALSALRLAVQVTARFSGVRGGCHLGNVTLTAEGDLLGHTLSVAKRLETRCRWGQLRISAEMLQHLPEDVAFAEFQVEGELVLKGIGAVGSVLVLPGPFLNQRPYKFLDAYARDDHPLFFGRRQEVLQLREVLKTQRWAILLGRSGVGKSSLLAAGLFASYDPAHTAIHRIRCLTDPLQALAAVNLSQSSLTTVVVFDQFEELFVRFTAAQRRPIVEALSGFLQSDELSHVAWIFSLREDFLAEMSEFEEFIPVFLDYRFRLTNLSCGQARECMVGPAERCGLVVEEALVEALAQELDEEGIDPPKLQIVLDRLDHYRPNDSLYLKLDTYQRLGGVRQILVDYLYEVVDRHPEAVARRILLAMISPQGTKEAVSLAEISGRLDLPVSSLESVMNALLQARLVRSLSEFGLYELAHEYLMEEIQSWADEAELAARHARMILEHELESWSQLQSLLSRERLEFLGTQRDRLIASQDERLLLLRASLLYGLQPEFWLPCEGYSELLLNLLSLPLEGVVHRSVIEQLFPLELGDEAFQVLLQACLRVGNPSLLRRLESFQRPRLLGEVREQVLQRYFGGEAMARVPSGPAWLGSSPQQKRQRKQNLPEYLHEKVDSEPNLYEVSLQEYWIDRCLVTHRDYAEFLPGHRDRYPEEEADHPVVCVTWHEAQAYAQWLGKELPSQEHWEKAARGPSGRVFPWGDLFEPQACNGAHNGLRRTSPVTAHKAGQSPYGCLDMAGNVWEWTASPWAEGSPFWVQKGGSTLCSEGQLWASSRMDAFPDFVLQWVGFRLMTPRPPEFKS